MNHRSPSDTGVPLHFTSQFYLAWAKREMVKGGIEKWREGEEEDGEEGKGEMKDRG